ncbi:conserved hypothetical protein [Talaromyces stipitatus ATCC 10500]|uniref:Uncharacterized protein n=1 Tax=Talaromyces stipitatus (strain ATCC 10500 / CBS 375.48 / QM 6759 / NRRL 1006) TaxID=441959 RepID=B8M0L5_TALSN|nr:uncharacterized protein TSTA_086290 [Talaromyces stipitatus ATCC 10500]EED21398.1 conserved hypothetical protein [Talaromyces stipitatus ATCC 10500]
MASKKINVPLDESWVVSEFENSNYSQSVIVEGIEAASASFPTDNISPVSSFSESDLIKEYEDEEPAVALPSSPPNPIESTATLASSVSSGPELIMPSIMFDTHSSDHGSWVIPRKRSIRSLYESRKAPRIPKARSEASSQERKKHQASKKEPLPATTPSSDKSARDYFAQVKGYLSEDINRYQLLRVVLNSLLVLMTMHLLIFPELFHQMPVLCKVPGAPKVYSQTCTRSNRTIAGIPPASHQSTVRTQIQLQNYLNQTIQDMAPLDVLFKDTDIILRDIYTAMRQEYGSARREIELEFEGAWAASRSISRTLISLKVDMKSTVDGFQAPIHRLEYLKGAASIFIRLMGREKSAFENEEEPGDMAMNHFGRLSQELDTSIAHLVHRTDRVLVHLAKLDDHLQSIQKLGVREQYRLHPKPTDGNRIQNMLNSLSGFIQGPKISESFNSEEQENIALDQLERLVSYHNFLADVVGRLDRELKALQKLRSIRT